jgi:hypothetical protein
MVISLDTVLHMVYWCFNKIKEVKMFKMKNGYMGVWSGGKHKYVHRVVMEEHIGRKLTRQETVHHLNEDKCDNRIENLLIMSNKDHVLFHTLFKGNICSFEGCGKPTKAFGLCRLHYRRQRAGCTIVSAGRTRINHDQCTVEGCDLPHKGHGYCVKHYFRFKKTGVPPTLDGDRVFTKR